MIIINKNNLSACLFAPNGYFYIIFLYFYPLIFYTKGWREHEEKMFDFSDNDERKEKCFCNRLIISRLQKHRYWEVKA